MDAATMKKAHDDQAELHTDLRDAGYELHVEREADKSARLYMRSVGGHEDRYIRWDASATEAGPWAYTMHGCESAVARIIEAALGVSTLFVDPLEWIAGYVSEAGVLEAAEQMEERARRDGTYGIEAETTE